MIARVHPLTFGSSWTYTASPVFRLGRSLALLLLYLACSCFWCYITLLYRQVWFCCCVRSGNKHLNFLEFSNSASEGRLWFKGVVMYERIAKCRSSPPSMASVRLFLIVCTKHSTWPLDCALVGDVTLCCMSHILVKSELL